MAAQNDDVGTQVDDTAAEAVTEPKAPEAPVEKAVDDDADKPEDAEDEKDSDEDDDNEKVADEPEPLAKGVTIS